jgi:hypothetical protein
MDEADKVKGGQGAVEVNWSEKAGARVVGRGRGDEGVEGSKGPGR